MRESLGYGLAFDNRHDALISVVDFVIDNREKVKDYNDELDRLKCVLTEIGKIVDDAL